MTGQSNRDDPLAGLRPPRAPRELESSVLAAASRALDEPPPTIWNRLWSSRPLRLGWSVATLVLLLAHLGLSVAPFGSPGSRQARSMPGNALRELNDILDVPAVEISPRAEALCFGRSSKKKNEKAKEVSG